MLLTMEFMQTITIMLGKLEEWQSSKSTLLLQVFKAVTDFYAIHEPYKFVSMSFQSLHFIKWKENLSECIHA